MIKTTGAEFKKFYDDSTFWSQGAWHDSEEVYVDDVLYGDDYSEINDYARVKIVGGSVFVSDEPGSMICSFETYFKRWKKSQENKMIVISVPNDRVEEVLLFLKTIKGVRVK